MQAPPPKMVKAHLSGCPACGGDHLVFRCSHYREMPIQDRREILHQVKVCLCCLKPGHFARACPKKKKCSGFKCPYYHHPLIHDPGQSSMYICQELEEWYPMETFEVEIPAMSEEEGD